jgi:methyl-accepting chemotaxis protein
MLASLIAGAAALTIALWIVMIQVTRPLTSLTSAMKELAAGNFSVVLPGLGRQDEVGGIAAAVEEFKSRLEEKMRLDAEKEREIAQREQAERDERARHDAELAAIVAKVVASLGIGLDRLAHGDLTYRLTDEFSADYKKVQDNFNAAIDQLQETVRSIALSSSEISSAASEISASTTDLSQRTEEQAASIEETSASMEEIAATVKKNAENAQHASHLAREARAVADRGGEVVSQAVAAMTQIEGSSQRISDIIIVIDEIARQTNLLALNAAVEAARAGEAGRGFAVVASEVRNLAQRASQAAKDIKDLIVNSSSQVKEGAELVNRAGHSLSEILQSIQNVADIVSDIATASAEQAAGVEQINKALNQMDEVTQQNSALVEENSATAKTLEEQQAAMDARLGFFRFEEGRPASAAAAPKPTAPRVAPVRGNLAVRVEEEF